MSDEESKRDNRGRFAAGNQAARKKYRRRRQSTSDLIRLVNRKLKQTGVNRSLDELIAEAACQLLTAAANGNGQAAIWVLERFYPAESERHFLSHSLPSPCESPLEYLDSLANAVTDSQLTTTQASRMSQLARPFVIDAELRKLADLFTDLQTKSEGLEAMK